MLLGTGDTFKHINFHALIGRNQGQEDPQQVSSLDLYAQYENNFLF